MGEKIADNYDTIKAKISSYPWQLAKEESFSQWTKRIWTRCKSEKDHTWRVIIDDYEDGEEDGQDGEIVGYYCQRCLREKGRQK